LDDYAAVRAPADPAADLTLAVTHAPYLRVLDAMTADGADLLLAGHTHGGQLCVPGFGALVTNCDLPTRYAKGLHRWSAAGRQSWLHVSAGLGTSPYARVRFACPPEATLLTLRARS
jgi:predicted MPP superfamily phosphohydrolase